MDLTQNFVRHFGDSEHVIDRTGLHNGKLLTELGRIRKTPKHNEGKVEARYSSVVSVKEVEINIAQLDEMVQFLEARIEGIQAELDVHNATTQI